MIQQLFVFALLASTTANQFTPATKSALIDLYNAFRFTFSAIEDDMFCRPQLDQLTCANTSPLVATLYGIDMVTRFPSLTSTIPTTIGNIASLTDLELDGNIIGAIPSEIGNLRLLTRLRLRTMFVNSVLPSELGLLTGVCLIEVIDKHVGCAGCGDNYGCVIVPEQPCPIECQGLQPGEVMRAKGVGPDVPESLPGEPSTSGSSRATNGFKTLSDMASAVIADTPTEKNSDSSRETDAEAPDTTMFVVIVVASTFVVLVLACATVLFLWANRSTERDNATPSEERGIVDRYPVFDTEATVYEPLHALHVQPGADPTYGSSSLAIVQ